MIRRFALSTSRARSLIGLMLAIPLAALMAGIFACLPVPVGDPETSKVDAALVGGWIVSSGENSSTLYIVRSFDPRSYVIQSLEFETNADKSIKPTKTGTMKAWLTTIGDKRFITADMFNPSETLGMETPEEKKIYFVAAVSIKGEELELRTIDGDNALVKTIKTSADAEKILKENGNDPKLYTEKPVVFKKVTKAQADTVKAVLAAFHLD